MSSEIEFGSQPDTSLEFSILISSALEDVISILRYMFLFYSIINAITTKAIQKYTGELCILLISFRYCFEAFTRFEGILAGFIFGSFLKQDATVLFICL